MTVPGAIELIAQLTRGLPQELMVGAGTVTDADTARRAIDAGARFVVSPVFRRDVIDACHERDVPAMPGCFTPTEILDAWEAGADIVKVFPSTSLGPTYEQFHRQHPQPARQPRWARQPRREWG